MSPETVQRLPQMSGLFLKIFFGVWGAMTVAGIILLAIETERSEQSEQRWRRVIGESFAFYAVSAAQEYEEGKRQGLSQYLANLNSRTGIHAWLFNEQGRELSGYAPARLKSDKRRLDEPVRRLTSQADGSGRTALERVGPATWAVHVTRLSDGRYYRLVGELPAVRYDFHYAQPMLQALRLLAVLIISGAISWVLSRHIATPIEKLRAVAQRLAEGDLTARAGSQLGARGDELGQLSHDFDRMADNIETLLSEQERMMAAQRRFLRDISHELRSPLARLGVALELARDRVEEMQANIPQEPAQETTTQETAAQGTAAQDAPFQRTPLTEIHNRIEREATYLSEMINRLLALSRLESGVQRAEAVAVDLPALVQAVAADAGFEAHRKQCAVNVIVSDTCSDDACTTYGTHDLLRSAIENVVRNAVRHTPQNTTVVINLRCDLSWIIITIRDHGPGVPREELPNLFQPFFRTGRARDYDSGSTGLGLAITERAVQLHGGMVSAVNALDGGLIVELRLPSTNQHGPTQTGAIQRTPSDANR